MSVGLLVVSHNDIGTQLFATASSILRQKMPPIRQVSIPSDLEPEVLGKYADLIRNAMLEQDTGDGVLVLTDAHGATPDNLARYFCNECNAVVVSGINLPMLLRVLNYAHQPLEQLCETALNGGRSGVQQGNE